MRVPVVVDEMTIKLYPRLAITVQPPCTRLVFEDSTGAAVADLLVSVQDIYRLLDELRREEFLDQWADDRHWLPEWPDDFDWEDRPVKAASDKATPSAQEDV